MQHQTHTEIIIIAIIAGTLFGCFILSFILLYQKRRAKHLQEKQRLQSEFNQTLLQSQLGIQEQTLKNISGEIHDNIGQILSLTKLNLGMIDIDKPHQFQQKIDDSKNLVGKAIQDLRDISKRLNTDYMSTMDLVEAIGYELEMIRKSGAYAASLKTEGLPIKLETPKELIIFRIIQEVINNIIKHARANTIFVLLTYEPDAFSISINDNGTGFDLALLSARENSKFGSSLRNMHKRAHLIGAHFTIASTLGVGTTITLLLPLAAGNTGNG